MKSATNHFRSLAVALLALTAGTVLANAQAANQKQDATSAAKEKAKATTSSTANVQKLIQELNKTRDDMITNHEALLKQLKDATEANKKEVLKKMEEQRKAFEEVTSALQKRIADERRKQRMGGGK